MRNRSLNSGHYTFLWLEVLVIKVRELGRPGERARLGRGRVNADGREVLGLNVCSDEDGAGWLAFLCSLTAAACPACPGSGLPKPTTYATCSPGAQERCPGGSHVGAHRVRPTLCRRRPAQQDRVIEAIERRFSDYPNDPEYVRKFDC